jgi:predicted RNA-binding protein with PIN domain
MLECGIVEGQKRHTHQRLHLFQEVTASDVKKTADEYIEKLGAIIKRGNDLHRYWSTLG